VLVAKFLYQLPLFCPTPAFTIYDSETCNLHEEIPPEILITRLDYIVGLRKFSGPASYPRDEGILSGLGLDIAIIVTLMFLKTYLVEVGRWDYVRTGSGSIYETPSFAKDEPDLTPNEKFNMECNAKSA
jgi:hypothetical protein